MKYDIYLSQRVYAIARVYSSVNRVTQNVAGKFY